LIDWGNFKIIKSSKLIMVVLVQADKLVSSMTGATAMSTFTKFFWN